MFRKDYFFSSFQKTLKVITWIDNMLIVSQNLANYGMALPKDTIFRFNLAWIDSIDSLENLLQKHSEHKILLDLPVNRVKPPGNNFTLDDLIPIIQNNHHIKYFAISNVESAEDIQNYVKLIPKDVIIIPKIENQAGILNLQEIIKSIQSNEKIVMLDHDDLFSSLVKNNESTTKFKDCVNQLIDFCEKNKVILLRTRGVIFSDDEKRIT